MKINLTIKPCSTLNTKTGGWRTYKPVVDLNKCIGCGTCKTVCPEGCAHIIIMKDKKKAEIDYNYCKGCGICASECPVKAIVMELDKK